MYVRSIAIVLLILAAIVPDASVDAQSSSAISVVGGGLVNPHGLAIDGAGQVLVAEAGIGGNTAGSTEIAPPVGPLMGGLSGTVSTISEGCPTVSAAGLASVKNSLGDTFGPSAVARIGDLVYVLVSGGGGENGNPEHPTGVYRIDADGPALIADLGQWFASNPTETAPGTGVVVGGIWSGMVAASDGSTLLAVEQSAGQIVRVTPDGAVERFADLSSYQSDPSSISIDPSGNLYVGMLTREPFAAGSAFVLRLTPDGSAVTVWSGLTMISGVAIGSDGTLYASQRSESRTEPPFLIPGSGSIVRQTGADTNQPIVSQVNLPGALTVATDGSLLAVISTSGADSGTGLVVRIEGPAETSVAGESIDLSPPSCISGQDGVEVVVDDLGFNPSTVTISTGITVTWRFGGEFDHAVASESDSELAFDSGVLPPGSTFSVTFTDPGTYRYFDGLYPERTAEIVVTSP